MVHRYLIAAMLAIFLFPLTMSAEEIGDTSCGINTVVLNGGGLYSVGETVSIQLTESIDVNLFQQVDLYVIIEMPGEKFLYLTNEFINPFSSEVTPFLRSMQHSEESLSIFTFMVPPGYGGSYYFYAFFNDEGADFSSLFKTLSSNVARTTVILADQ